MNLLELLGDVKFPAMVPDLEVREATQPLFSGVDSHPFIHHLYVTFLIRDEHTGWLQQGCQFQYIYSL